MTTTSAANPSPQWDLTNCDREPIHIPGCIQPHGLLLVLDEATLNVIQASENAAALLNGGKESPIGKSLDQLFPQQTALSLIARLAKAPAKSHPMYLQTIELGSNDSKREFDAVAHRAGGGVVLELECIDDVQSSASLVSDLHMFLDQYSLRIEAITDVAQLCQETASTVRGLTGFDRVLVYQFDVNWNGIVVGENGNGRLPEYLHHKFPASDIPAQARELYRLNRVRIIPDASYQPIEVRPAVNPTTGRSLDMTYSTLRSVSPIHVEYMRNMETASSMSISILRRGNLWGLISCHHRQPRMIPVGMRTTCDLITRAFALRLSALEESRHYERRLEVRSVYSKLLAVMADRGDFAAALAEHPADVLSFVAAEGAAVLTEGECVLIGKTPNESQVRDVAKWLFESIKNEVYHSDWLSRDIPAAATMKQTASGLLAVAVSQLHPSYVMWFRPEVIQTNQWGGNPHKPIDAQHPQLRMHPRKSFDTWQEIVRDKSLPWDESEIDGAIELRTAIVGIVLRKAEELADLNAELTRSNKELEAFSYSVSHDLRAPLRHIVGYAEMLKESRSDQLSARDERCINVIIESSEYAGKLVDKLLGYSRLGRAELQLSRIDLNTLVQEIRQDVMRDAVGRTIRWQIAALPVVVADLMMLRMAIRDLISNAVKYTSNRPEAIIEMGTDENATERTFWVKDNGVGFDMKYADKLFGVFQRLHRWEDFEGTGIGLANVRRVIERHRGRTWAEGGENQGATFYFSLPKSLEGQSHA